MFHTPILFLIFNRPDTTKKVFESIRLQKPSKLYIAADGPREGKDDEDNLCNQTRQIALNIDWPCEVKTLFREKNLGCKIAVSSAIDWFFENEEQGIILEDDCLPNNSFFTFCEVLLNKYKNDLRVMHISGCVLNYNFTKEYLFSYYFTKIPSIWGWATWRRAWKLYDVNMQSYDNFRKQNLLDDTIGDKRVKNFHTKIFKHVFDENKDTWDYQWNYTILSNYGLSILPIKSMVTNIGFDVNALNSINTKSDLAQIKTFELKEIIHPDFVVHNSTMEYEYLRETTYKSFLYRTKVFNKLTAILKK